MPLGYTRLNEKTQRPNQNINFIKPLDGPRKDQSFDFLSRIAAISAPIMASNHILVNSLEEFEPNREFWGRNFNAGEAVQLVLRSPSTGQWLPFRFVAMVFMHELAHCKVMAHNRAFWQVRNSYSTELRALCDKGYTGDGVWGRGQALHEDYSAEQPFPTADEELVRSLCGGAYSGVGEKRKRKAKAGKPQLTYAEKKQKRIAKKFGANGSTLGDDADTRTKLENGKKVKGKPRVAGSNRGRELRAAALLDRLEQSKKEAAQTEEEDSETEDDSDYEELMEGQHEAVNASGQPILDSTGRRLVQVCEGEDHVHDLDAQREMEELLQMGYRQSAKRRMPQDLTSSIKQEDFVGQADDYHGRSNGTNIVSDNTLQKEASLLPKRPRAHSRSSTPNTITSVDASHTKGKDTVKATPDVATELPCSCPICSLNNFDDALTCAACAHVLQPGKLTNHWRCMESSCRESRYINSGDSGVCGICGVSKGN